MTFVRKTVKGIKLLGNKTGISFVSISVINGPNNNLSDIKWELGVDDN